MYRVVKGFIFIILVSVAIAGCTKPSELDTIRNSKGSLYSEGYGSGCGAGESKAMHPEYVAQKDMSLYQAHIRYKDGWDDGYKECLFRKTKVMARIAKSKQ